MLALYMTYVIKQCGYYNDTTKNMSRLVFGDTLNELFVNAAKDIIVNRELKKGSTKFVLLSSAENKDETHDIVQRILKTKNIVEYKSKKIELEREEKRIRGEMVRLERENKDIAEKFLDLKSKAKVIGI